MSLLLKNARVWDGMSDDYVAEGDIACVDGLILTAGEAPADPLQVIDLKGQALLPGFIDAHFHAYAAMVNIPQVESLPLSYLAHHAAELLQGALKRGFTTVRDAGGADWGLWRALEDGVIVGPRLFYSGHALSQTGGHGDSRAAAASPCSCASVANLSRLADGVDAVRRAARENLRRGATQIKIFVSGGVSSPADPIWMLQYSADEIRAAVEEAATRRTYVMAHAYGADAIVHAVNQGVRSIEHGNLIDDDAARRMAEMGAYLVPTLITYEALAADGERLGLSSESRAKLSEVLDRGRSSIGIARRAGVPIGFGTDLLGALHSRQLEEFRIRSYLERPVDVLRSATSVNARLMMQEDRLGRICPGAAADMVVFDGDPLRDLSVVWRDGPRAVIKAGRIVHDAL